MDFFERQESARRHTKLLEVYFALAVLSIILTTYLAVVAVLSFQGNRHHAYEGDSISMQEVLWNPKLLLGVSLGTLTFIFCGSAFKTMQLASGGSAVAELLGGRPVDANTNDPDERKLLNVVEEMAIASGTPVPQVYILPGEGGINAFAAGHSTRDMVVCATRGCVRRLNRDELQGVIGHEFSHILNGDMRLNLRLMGLVFGILCLALFGRILMNTRGDRDRRNPLPIIGLALLVIGYTGVFFAKLIKSAISRQREFLADAASVQFTRNPAGLASALKKVGGAGSRIDDPNAEDASHFFFANGMGEAFADSFSTHPPLEERIRALDPAWDGKFISTDTAEEIENTKQKQAAMTRLGPSERLDELLGGPKALAGVSSALSAAALMRAGSPTAKHLDYAADLRSKLPETLSAAAREPMGAVALIYALLLSREDAMRARQLAQLQTQADPAIYAETVRLSAEAAKLESRARLPLASLTMTALRRLSPPQYDVFTKNIQFVIESDEQIELFEYTLQKIVLRQLEPNFKPPKKPIIQFYVINPLVPDCAVLLSALAFAGQAEPTEVEKAFRLGAMKLGIPDLALTAPDACTLAQVDTALNRLNQTVPPIKKLVLNACAETVAADGVIQENEAELLRAIADTLDCPIPPIVSL
ncbi:MAG: htpX 1 [Pedosphaera sp.]|nr:htpX 1 [Pedosphaera sp.]